MDLADPPMFERFLLENPWPLTVGLVAVALALLTLASRRRQKGLLGGAVVATLLAGGVLALSHFVTTDREVITDRSRQLLDATAPFNADKLRALLDDDATVSCAERIWVPAGQVVAAAEGRLSRRQVAHAVRSIEAEADDAGRGRTALRVVTTFDAGASGGEQRSVTEWVFVWRRDGVAGPWKVVDLQLVKWNGQDPPCGSFRR